MGSATAQGDVWGALAEDWAYWAEPTTEPLWRAVLMATMAGPSKSLLDIGCGAGGLAVAASPLGVSIDGLDASEALIDIARQRVPHGRFQVGDIEDLPYAEGTFDIVTACNCLQFAEDQKKAAMEARRVLKPDGLLGVGMWCEPDRCDMRAVFGALGSLSATPPPSGPSLTLLENLTGLLESAGLTVRDGGEVECVFQFPSMDEAWRGLRSPGMVVAISRRVGEERVREAVTAAIRQFVRPDGSVRMSNWFRYVVSSR